MMTSSNGTKSDFGKIKKVSGDFFYNILASVIYLGVLQIVVYPIIADYFGAEINGLFLTIIAIVNVICMTLGSMLNNARLIQNSKYIEIKASGDFNILLLAATAIGAVALLLVMNIGFTIDIATQVLVVAYLMVYIINTYVSVAYRLRLNFKMNLAANIVTSIGLLMGIFLMKYTKLWPMPFVISGILTSLFLLRTTDLLREPCRKTPLFKDTSMRYGFLMISGILSGLVMYLDKFIVFPSLGGAAVTTYNTASFFGKSLGMLMMPIAGILLSYYARTTFVMTRKRFWRINAVVFSASIVFFLISLWLSPWFTGLLYPKYIGSAMPFIVLANLAAIIGVAALMTDPVVLKFAPTYWQIILYLTYAVAYIGLSIILIIRYNLLGLCIASICANSLKLISLYFLGNHYLKKVPA